MDEPDFSLAASRVAIVGLGLMGGSLGLALRGRCREIVGVDADLETQAAAQSGGAIDRAVDWETAVQADVLILATPPRVILAQLAQLARLPQYAIRNTVVLDLGSTKAHIVAAMQALPPRFEPIGGHPMCGKEVSGLAQAEAELYRGKAFILTPTARTTARALQWALELIATIGAHPVVLRDGAARHDSLAALVSHLPYTVAAALVRTALAASQDDQLWPIAASGFRDTSRLAASDLTMMTDILLTNRAAVLDTLRLYRHELDTLTSAIESGDAEALQAVLKPAQQKRRELFQ